MYQWINAAAETNELHLFGQEGQTCGSIVEQNSKAWESMYNAIFTDRTWNLKNFKLLFRHIIHIGNKGITGYRIQNSDFFFSKSKTWCEFGADHKVYAGFWKWCYTVSEFQCDYSGYSAV